MELKCPSNFLSGHLRSGGILLGRGEIPGREFLDAVDGVISDPIEHAAEIEFRIQPVELGCPQQRVDGCGAVTAGIGTAGQEVFPIQSHSAQSPFGRRVVHLDLPIVEVARERTPARQRIANRRSRVGLA